LLGVSGMSAKDQKRTLFVEGVKHSAPRVRFWRSGGEFETRHHTHHPVRMYALTPTLASFAEACRHLLLRRRIPLRLWHPRIQPRLE
jgi:hypothetical protein